MNWLQFYLIGMAITFVVIMIAAIRENIFEDLTPMYNIVITFFALILWPIFDIAAIIIMIDIKINE